MTKSKQISMSKSLIILAKIFHPLYRADNLNHLCFLLGEYLHMKLKFPF